MPGKKGNKNAQKHGFYAKLYTLEELRLEAYAQTKRDFTDESSKEFEMVDFYTKLHRAMEAG